MEKLIVGIDLCDTYTQAAVLGREEAWMLPTVICRKKSAEEWYVGEDAYVMISQDLLFDLIKLKVLQRPVALCGFYLTFQ